MMFSLSFTLRMMSSDFIRGLCISSKILAWTISVKFIVCFLPFVLILLFSFYVISSKKYIFY